MNMSLIGEVASDVIIAILRLIIIISYFEINFIDVNIV